MTRNCAKHHVVAALLLVVPFALIAKQPRTSAPPSWSAPPVSTSFFFRPALEGHRRPGCPGAPRRRCSGTSCTTTSANASSPSSDPTTDPSAPATHHPGHHRHRIWGAVGRAISNGTQTHLEVHPGETHRLHLRRHSREWGPIGNGSYSSLYTLLVGRGLISPPPPPSSPACWPAPSPSSSSPTPSSEHGHGEGILPVVGVPAALRQLWRHGAGDLVPGDRHSDVDPYPSDAGQNELLAGSVRPRF